MPYAENEGTRIYWETHGAGDPLLLIMGLGHTSAMWYRLQPLLAQYYQTILLDNRGVGRSDIPQGPYPIATMAADALAVLDAAGVDRAHVFGLSMGGMIAQELALQSPLRVRSLILGCTACGGAEAIPVVPEILEQLLTAPLRMTPEESFWAVAPYIYAPSTPRTLLLEDLTIRLQTYPPVASYLAQLQGAMVWTGSYSRLAELSLPTLLIHGEFDQLVPPENARVLAEAIPGANLVLLPQASHIFPTDQQEAAGQAILSFLATVD